LTAYDAGLVTVVNEKAGPALWFWLSVIEKLAPNSLATLETAVGTKVLQGSSCKNFDEDVLEALRQAHHEAVPSSSQ
jgi:hypothetical protein